MQMQIQIDLNIDIGIGIGIDIDIDVDINADIDVDEDSIYSVYSSQEQFVSPNCCIVSSLHMQCIDYIRYCAYIIFIASMYMVVYIA